jgi:predicted transcriptional regulator
MAGKKRAESREGMIVTTVALPPQLHKRVMLAALERNTAAAELIRQAIAQFLDRPRGTRK